MRVVEKITGTAGCYVLTGTVCRDDRGGYFARAHTHLLTQGAVDRTLRSVATAQANGADIEATGATAPEARARLCLAARERLAATVTGFVWRPVAVLVSGQWGSSASGERTVTSRLAYTSGAMLVVTAGGASQRVPAGACHIGPLSASRFRTVRWSENGVERTAQMSAENLSAYLQGCIVQYA